MGQLIQILMALFQSKAQIIGWNWENVTPGIDVQQLIGENVAHCWKCWLQTHLCYRVVERYLMNNLWQSIDTSLQRAHKPDSIQVFFWPVFNLVMELALISGSRYDLPLETFVILAGKSDNQSWLKIKGCFLSVLYSVLC